MGNIVKRGMEASYSPALMVGPRAMSVLMYLDKSGKTGVRDICLQLGTSVTQSIASLRQRGLVVVTGVGGIRNRVVRGNTVQLSAEGAKMAMAYRKVMLPANGGVLGSQA